MKQTHFIFISLCFFAMACGSKSSAPTGKSKMMKMDESGDSFGSKRKMNNRAPQMGFYYKKPKATPIATTSFKIRYFFADNRKKQAIGNEQTATSTQYNNDRLSESLDKMGNSFTKGKLIRRRKATRANDRTSDSFAKNPNKKERKGLFRRK